MKDWKDKLQKAAPYLITLVLVILYVWEKVTPEPQPIIVDESKRLKFVVNRSLNFSGEIDSFRIEPHLSTYYYKDGTIMAFDDKGNIITNKVIPRQQNPQPPKSEGDDKTKIPKGK